MYLKVCIGCLLCVTLGTVQARVYKWIDVAGQVHYSDQPTQDAKNAQEIHLNVPQTSSDQSDTSSALYNFELVQPEENQTINTDNGELIISLLIDPALQPEHSFQFTLDSGLIPKNFTQTQVVLSPVPLGTHKLYATIVDTTGKVIMQSKTVTFHLRKGSPTIPSETISPEQTPE